MKIKRNTDDGTITLTQDGLIKQIIDALNISHLSRTLTPDFNTPLIKDEDGNPPKNTWNYASVVGMLHYLQGHSRTKITYAVSQCARFVHSTKKCHVAAVEMIGRYLKGKKDKGLVLNQTDELTSDVFVDSDFSGLWPHKNRIDPTLVKSRTGVGICL